MFCDPLTKEQVIAAIERRGRGVVPVLMGKWWGDGLHAKYGSALKELEQQFPDDICELWYTEPGYEVSPTANPEYRYGFKDYTNVERHSIGNVAVILDDWADLDRLLEHFPDPNEPGNFDAIKAQIQPGDTRYRLGCWWRLLHERFWSIRGMENLMMDYYDNMDGLKRLGERIIEYYKVIVRRYKTIGCDGIFTSDDLGHQTGPMMSPAVFEELYLPLYREIIGYTHDLGMHFFLHSCGDNTKLMEMLIEAGLDVFHPVQKGCMDMKAVGEEFGGRISFLAGVDVQQLLPNGSPEQIREEIRRMKEELSYQNSGLLLAMGNGIMPDTPLENIRVALEEMYSMR